MDEGLLGGLAEGIQSGLSSYKDARKMKMDAEAQAKQAALQQRQMALSEAKDQMEFDPTSNKYQLSEQGRIDKLNKEKLSGLEKNYLPTYDEKGSVTGRTLLPTEPKKLSPLEEAQLRKTNAEIAKLSSETGSGRKGKTLPGGEITTVAEANSIVDQLSNFDKTLQKSDVAGGGLGMSFKRGVGGLIGAATGEDPIANKVNSLEAEQKILSQTVGRYLEGGKLSDSDAERYRKMLPQVSDTAEVRSQKIDVLQNLIAQRQAALAKGYGEAGYDISGISLANVPKREKKKDDSGGKGLIETANASAPLPTVPKLGEVVNGFSYIGGDPANPKSWTKQKSNQPFKAPY